MTPRLPRAAAILAMAAALLVSCSEQPIIDYEPTPGPPASPVPGPPAADAPVHPPAGEGFFSVLRPGSQADLVSPPDSLRAAYAEATAVIEADVAAVHAEPSRGEPALVTVIIELRPVRVLRGALQSGVSGTRIRLLVGRDGDRADELEEQMRGDLPARGIWLLRWQGKPPDRRKPGAPSFSPAENPAHYRTIHPECGIFVQGAEHVVAPAARDLEGLPPRGAQAEAERFATLDELAAHARAPG
ncbi:hypothetical protein [Actinoplanes sp. NPDC049802]|uniref:hypothetical protein n=1 Tax=Actinoplanes sp. NPDC049802 TaxID=3154742 RepID=UPI00340F1A69